MTKIKIGDIFEIETPKGKAYLHYLHYDTRTGELIRVLQGLYPESPNNIEDIAKSQERYMISFPLKSAFKKKIVRLAGFYPVDSFRLPEFMRTEHSIRGEFIGWHIVNTDNWKRELVKTLSPEQKKLSPWGIWNDTLLIEYLVTDWSLSDWT